MFNNLMESFYKENGHHAVAYDGYYDKKEYWESELSRWLSTKGFPCLMYTERKSSQNGKSTIAYDPIGVEMDKEIATVFIITWS